MGIHNIESTTFSEKRLEILNTISTTLFTSVKIEDVFQKANHLIAELMSAEISLIFTMDEKNNELILAASEGVSEKLTFTNKKIKISDGIYSQVALSGNPIITENVPSKTDIALDLFQDKKIYVQLIVPIKLKDTVRGIICVARQQARKFTAEDILLLTSVVTQIAVAIENARLYNEQTQISNQLAISESKYRRLFEHASDAIWANDFSGKITIANGASAELMGDSMEEMIGSDVRSFLPPEGLKTARYVREMLLDDKTFPQPYEQHLIRKRDKTQVILMVSTSLVKYGNQPPVFEHIARDVTKERRMQDNLRYYVQQITRTQEEERTRIARDLHDDTVQALYVLTRSLDNYVRSSKNISPDTASFLKNIEEQVRSILQGVRRFSQELRPPMLDDLGLISALRWLVGDLEQRCGITANIEITGAERRLAQYAELVIFRIVQEALRNVEKHANASKIMVTVNFVEGEVNITISDNGKGFKLSSELGELPREGRLGLVGMEERAKLIGGNIKIQSELNQGTRILIELPV
jgi:two-component system, NarL family, sensor histidine kinase DegS